jgi:hypothetical protein
MKFFRLGPKPAVENQQDTLAKIDRLIELTQRHLLYLNGQPVVRVFDIR